MFMLLLIKINIIKQQKATQKIWLSFFTSDIIKYFLYY